MIRQKGRSQIMRVSEQRMSKAFGERKAHPRHNGTPLRQQGHYATRRAQHKKGNLLQENSTQTAFPGQQSRSARSWSLGPGLWTLDPSQRPEIKQQQHERQRHHDGFAHQSQSKKGEGEKEPSPESKA